MKNRFEMLKQRCSADMSNPSEQIVPKRIGKFVTFSQECDNPKRDLENAIVFPKTKAPEKVVQVVGSWSPEYPRAEEIIVLPYTHPELREDMKYEREDCMPSSSHKNDDFQCRSNCLKTTKRTLAQMKQDFTRRDLGKNLIMVRRDEKMHKETQMKVISKKLKHIYQRKQMDDLTALCKEKMSISTKETEKMDEDSND